MNHTSFEGLTENYRSIKKELLLKQDHETLFISGSLDKQWMVKRLVLVSRASKTELEFSSATNSSDFSYQLHLPTILKEHPADYIDLYIEADISQTDFERVAKEMLPSDLEFSETIRLRLGEFEKTRTEGLENLIYLTKNNNFSIAVNKKFIQKPIIDVKTIELTNQAMSFTGAVYVRNSKPQAAELLWIGRDSNQRCVFPLDEFQEAANHESYFGLLRYNFSVQLDTTTWQERLTDDIYDIYVSLTLTDGNTVVARLTAPEIKTAGESVCKQDQSRFVITPRVTHGKGNLSLIVTEFTTASYYFLQFMQRFAGWFRPFFTRKEIWLVGEIPYKAQDTGYQFFKYMREKHSKQKVYYVIDENSPEMRNLKQLGNIVLFKSMKHIFYTLMATKIVGSHHPDYLYPIRSNRFKSLVKAKKVFLQHGVMGTRNSTHYYGVESEHFETDLFIVSSEFEKKMIVGDFGYRPEKVKVTGLSRFDSLFANDVPVKKQLLIIPTWREWLTKEEGFLKSEYFDRYRALINHPKLHELAEKYKFEIVFCLHPNMQKYSKHFQQENVKIVNQGEIDVQQLLKESMIMITDYSSVAFDFSFLDKPVLYYQFDKTKFLGEKGSHLNLKKDLPGPIVADEAKLIETLEGYATNDFQMDETYQKRTKKFLKYKDQKANKRIFEAIRKL
ncbi:CDP-glycerol glycerophosphotransferase family protein [Anaerobacillus sp. CMMVII]|uniref:CDP-glycerol glycerophosphotransferase family protein n=1 Tax=Anaerobacillus sp. CMMVII TaxID=2755588 RepID=UPI0021B84503|nr:CDP-glycerol glycerophosphotransferase family protein [Anaerobacillus sp. CMMVII]MCT8140332.1 CDP-glycerol glycerophosphotransferase family protein [Anaerobacillus sp. CMMVII]